MPLAELEPPEPVEPFPEPTVVPDPDEELPLPAGGCGSSSLQAPKKNAGSAKIADKARGETQKDSFGMGQPYTKIVAAWCEEQLALRGRR